MTPLVPVTPRAVITSPNNNQTLLAGDIPIVTTVYPYASNAIQVDFFVDAQWVGVVTNPPFSFICQNLAPGQHSLQARTLSAQGGTALSQTITVFVIPRLQISSSLTSNGQLTLAWPSSELSLLMESATNLTPPVAWSPLTNPPTTLNGTNIVTFTPDAISRFFRVRRQ